MAKLSRTEFLATFENLTQRAKANFAKDGYVASVLTAFDAKGKQFLALGVDPAEVNSEDAQRARRQGVHVLPAPFREHQESVLAVLNEAKCVAAVVIAEAWYAADRVAMDVMEMGIRPSDHPSRREVVVVSAVWPREYVLKVNMMEIHRDAAGVGTLGEIAPMEVPEGQDGILDEWLSGMLPQPFGASARR